MFINNQPDEHKQEYYTLLKALGGLSGLFSDNSKPYLYYRAAERAFCTAFDAYDMSREDSSFDAKKEALGIGLKTFLYKPAGCTEKVAEFNSKSDEIRSLLHDEEALIRRVADMRNYRISTTLVANGLRNGMYHCVVRDDEKFYIHETDMPLINIDRIRVDRKKTSKNNLWFKDGVNTYKFSLSKSTLYKCFEVNNNIVEQFDVQILDDPFKLIKDLFAHSRSHEPEKENIVILPLYSDRHGRVMEKSGLNQWNAGGRARDEDEVYITVPLWIHQAFPDFFPPKDTSFNLKLPNNRILSAKICQQNGKALMSNPNKDLGKWMLRDVLKIPPDKLCTLDDLHYAGFDSVEVKKTSDTDFSIRFMPVGTFEEFKDQKK